MRGYVTALLAAAPPRTKHGNAAAAIVVVCSAFSNMSMCTWRSAGARNLANKAREILRANLGAGGGTGHPQTPRRCAIRTKKAEFGYMDTPRR